MNIEDLTIKQARELAMLFATQTIPTAPLSQSPMLGRHVIARTFTAGVHIGTVKSHNGEEVVLTDARRLWKWEGAFTLSEVAKTGVAKGSRIAVTLPEILLTNVNELIPTTEVARKTFEEFHEKA